VAHAPATEFLPRPLIWDSANQFATVGFRQILVTPAFCLLMRTAIDASASDSIPKGTREYTDN
jgi:hypothetical protein